jgi:hypothetical protein
MQIGLRSLLRQRYANDISQLLSQRHATAELVAHARDIDLILRAGGEP